MIPIVSAGARKSVKQTKVDGLQCAASRGDKVRDDPFPPLSSVLAASVQFLSPHH